MIEEIVRDAEKQMQRKRQKKRWKNIVKILAMVVVFCTTYALILPAITMEGSCQLTEHVHQDSCYTKILSEKDTSNVEEILSCSEHEHTEACWKEEKVLTCGKEETEDVVAEPEEESVSEFSEAGTDEEQETKKAMDEESVVSKRAVVHKHDEDCYTIEKKLICGYDNDHHHTEDCYEQKEKAEESEEPLTCTNEDEAHEHTERCYGTWELTCGMEEHVHDEDCNLDMLQEEEAVMPVVALEEDGVFKWEDATSGVTVDLTLSNTYLHTEYELYVVKQEQKNYETALNTYTKRGQQVEEAAIYKISLRRLDDNKQEMTSLGCAYTLKMSWSKGVFTKMDADDMLDFAYCMNSNNEPTTWKTYDVTYDGNGNVTSFTASDTYYPNSGEFLFVRSKAPNGLQAGNFNLTYNAKKDAFLKDAKYANYYNSNSPIGTAGSFHLVAFDTATLGAHTNGNVLAKNLIAKSNFGTNNYAYELSYVQNYKDVHATSASSPNHILVVGDSNKIDYADNGNAFSINGTKIDKPYYLIQDKDTDKSPFINLDRVKTEIGQVASNLNGFTDTNITYTAADNSNNNRSELHLEKPAGVGVYHCKASELKEIFGKYVKLSGFQSGKNGTIVINVDCSGVSSITMPEARVYIDGQEQSASEVIEFSAGKAIWNFTNAKGATINTLLTTGIVIAPGATVNIGQNLNGTVVADNINVNAESHRTDFTGKVTEPEEGPVTEEEYYVTVHKTETGYAGTALEGAEFDLYQWENEDWQKVNEGTLITGKNGTVVLHNLEQDVAYKLVEITAPEGYKLKDGAFYFWVRTDKNQAVPNTKPKDFVGSAVEVGGTLLAANDKLDEEEKDDNKDGYILPETGGYGSDFPKTVGLCIILVATLLLLCYNRKESEK